MSKKGNVMLQPFSCLTMPMCCLFIAPDCVEHMTVNEGAETTPCERKWLFQIVLDNMKTMRAIATSYFLTPSPLTMLWLPVTMMVQCWLHPGHQLRMTSLSSLSAQPHGIGELFESFPVCYYLFMFFSHSIWIGIRKNLTTGWVCAKQRNILCFGWEKRDAWGTVSLTLAPYIFNLQQAILWWMRQYHKVLVELSFVKEASFCIYFMQNISIAPLAMSDHFGPPCNLLVWQPLRFCYKRKPFILAFCKYFSSSKSFSFETTSVYRSIMWALRCPHSG